MSSWVFGYFGMDVVCGSEPGCVAFAGGSQSGQKGEVIWCRGWVQRPVAGGSHHPHPHSAACTDQTLPVKERTQEHAWPHGGDYFFNGVQTCKPQEEVANLDQVKVTTASRGQRHGAHNPSVRGGGLGRHIPVGAGGRAQRASAPRDGGEDVELDPLGQSLLLVGPATDADGVTARDGAKPPL